MHFSIDYFSATPGYLVTDVVVVVVVVVCHLARADAIESRIVGICTARIFRPLSLSPRLCRLHRAQFELSNFPPPPRWHYDSVCLYCSNRYWV